MHAARSAAWLLLATLAAPADGVALELDPTYTACLSSSCDSLCAPDAPARACADGRRARPRVALDSLDWTTSSPRALRPIVS